MLTTQIQTIKKKYKKDLSLIFSPKDNYYQYFGIYHYAYVHI